MRVAGVRTVIVLLNQRNLNLMEVNYNYIFDLKKLYFLYDGFLAISPMLISR